MDWPDHHNGGKIGRQRDQLAVGPRRFGVAGIASLLAPLPLMHAYPVRKRHRPGDCHVRLPAALVTACLLAYFSAETTPAEIRRSRPRPIRFGPSSTVCTPAASAPRTWAGGSWTWRSWRATRRRSTSPRPAAGSGRRPTAARPSRRSSTGSRRSCIGAVAVCQGKPEVVYVGTGEGNPRNQ